MLLGLKIEQNKADILVTKNVCARKITKINTVYPEVGWALWFKSDNCKEKPRIFWICKMLFHLVFWVEGE